LLRLLQRVVSAAISEPQPAGKIAWAENIQNRICSIYDQSIISAELSTDTND